MGRISKNRYTVHVRFKDQATPQVLHEVVNQHEEGSYTVVVLADGEYVKFNTADVWRIRVVKQD